MVTCDKFPLSKDLTFLIEERARYLSCLYDKDIKGLILTKSDEIYAFLYDNESRDETLRALGRYQSNPELSFTVFDAADLSQRIGRGKSNLQGRFELEV